VNFLKKNWLESILFVLFAAYIVVGIIIVVGKSSQPKPLTEKAFKAYIKQHNTKLDTRLHKMSEDTSKAIDSKFKDLLHSDQ